MSFLVRQRRDGTRKPTVLICCCRVVVTRHLGQFLVQRKAGLWSSMHCQYCTDSTTTVLAAVLYLELLIAASAASTAVRDVLKCLPLLRPLYLLPFLFLPFFDATRRSCWLC